VVLIRTSPVLDHSGGSFPVMKLAWSLGAGAELGDGRQRMPMISLEDYLGIVQWAAATPTASGPYNATIPQPATNAEFTEALARAVRRPRLLRAPSGVLRRVLGEQAEQLLGDMYIVPQRLTDQGFRFTDTDVYSTVASALAKD
jgi:NAD dependent epimerase/dehydratase family enzyme